MDIYSKKQKWKFTLLGFAIIIGISSIFVTNRLVKQLKNEERKKIEEMQSMQARKKGSRYGGMRSLLATREDAEIGVKKTTLG